MKKLIYFMTVAVLALGMMGCKKNQEVTEEPNYVVTEISLDVEFDANDEPVFVVKMTQDMPFVLAPLSESVIANLSDSAVVATILPEALKNPNSYVLNGGSGKYQPAYGQFAVGKYKVFAFAVDLVNNKLASNIASASFEIKGNGLVLSVEQDGLLGVKVEASDAQHTYAIALYDKELADNALQAGATLADLVLADFVQSVDSDKLAYPDSSYTWCAEPYLFVGSQTLDLRDLYSTISAGDHYVLVAGIDFIDAETAYYAKATTTGSSVSIHLDQDYVEPQAVKGIDGKLIRRKAQMKYFEKKQIKFHKID